MKKFIFLGLVLVSPSLVLAADAFSIVGTIGQWLGFVVPVLIALAVAWFIWGVIMYLIAGDEEKKKKATGMIVGGLIGLFIIVAFWGIIRLITNTFGVGPEQLNDRAVPCVPMFDPQGRSMGNCNNR
jgi:hypothetical protein